MNWAGQILYHIPHSSSNLYSFVADSALDDGDKEDDLYDHAPPLEGDGDHDDGDYDYAPAESEGDGDDDDYCEYALAA
ncbi:unnamed protein product [Lactuca virosa]|uniref:Uncharacterized protein n=1 Tax=Lactuca virosa TaxID=75947 RepID=A0AAU9MJN0_9ASTR|nr:unnamed protein product [Lactuca virosa]